MALANTGWDDYSFGRAVSSSRRPRRNSFSALIAGAVVASGMFAGLVAWHEAENQAPASATPLAIPAGPAGGRTARLSEAYLPSLERNAESFLRDSLLLAQTCRADCAPVTGDIVEAQRSGRFGPPGIATSPGNAPLATALPFQRQFGPQVAVPLSVMPPSAPTPRTQPDAAAVDASPAPSPAPVLVEPSVVVPLPPVFYAPAPVAAPIPATRLNRAPEDSATAGSSSEPMRQESLPSGRRMPSPLVNFGRNDGVAIYDISSATVYMPDGERLEAHSGMGPMVDNPRYVDKIDTGPTPPNTYNLIMRKGRFHGVEALRLIPANGDNRFGRVGLLAHTYLLRGRPAESNGCVAFKDYARFLEAFKRGDVRRLIVVPRLSGSPARVALASDNT